MSKAVDGSLERKMTEKLERLQMGSDIAELKAMVGTMEQAVKLAAENSSDDINFQLRTLQNEIQALNTAVAAANQTAQAAASAADKAGTQIEAFSFVTAELTEVKQSSMRASNMYVNLSRAWFIGEARNSTADLHRRRGATAQAREFVRQCRTQLGRVERLTAATACSVRYGAQITLGAGAGAAE